MDLSIGLAFFCGFCFGICSTIMSHRYMNERALLEEQNKNQEEEQRKQQEKAEFIKDKRLKRLEKLQDARKMVQILEVHLRDNSTKRITVQGQKHLDRAKFALARLELCHRILPNDFISLAQEQKLEGAHRLLEEACTAEEPKKWFWQ